MAAKSVVLFINASEGTEFILNYDDVTLVATSVTFIVPNTLGAPLTVNATNRNLNSGVPLTWQAPPSNNPGQYTFPTPIQGVAVTNRFGGMGIDFGWTQIQFGSVGVFPTPGNQVIHVTPNG